MSEKMTSAERTALLKLVARNARVAAADLDALAAERYAEWERQATAEWDAKQVGIEELMSTLNAELAPKVAELQERLTAWCDENGIAEAFRPKVTGGVGLAYAHAHHDRDRRADLRREAKAIIDAGKKRAKTEIERERAAIETKILSTAIESGQGAALLEQLPTAERLLPPISLAEVEAHRSGGGGR